MDRESYKLEARWGPRRESIGWCATRCARMLEGLATIDPIFAHWYKQGMSRAKANKPFCSMPPDIQEFRQIFARAPDFALSAWNGIDGPRGVSFGCWVGHGRNYPIFPNHVDISLPRSTPESVDLLTVAVLKPAILAVIAAWDPDWATVQAASYLERLGELGRGRYPRFRSGWMSYVSPRHAPRVSPPATVIVEHTLGGGLLMLATEERFTTANDDHVAVADAIQECLGPLQL
jgi:hypothetical protein